MSRRRRLCVRRGWSPAGLPALPQRNEYFDVARDRCVQGRGHMRTREKLTLEEKFALALELIKRERSLDEIRMHYRVSHTTAYKIRNMFLEGGRAALIGERRSRPAQDLEARVSVLE